MAAENGKIKICILSSVPVTLWSFYRGLIHQLQDDDFEVTLISSDFPELYKMKNELNCDILATTISRQISPLRDIISICKVRHYLRRQKFVIIHAHTPKGGLVGMISAWMARIPNRIYTVHGLPLETAKGLKKKLLWSAEWLSCKLATKLLAVSPSLMKRVVDKRFCPKEKITVLNKGSACGIDLRKFRLTKDVLQKAKRVRAQYHIPEEAIVIGFVGRIVPDKGIKVLVEAFKRLQQEIAQSYLLLIGEFETVRETFDKETMDVIRNNKHIAYNGQFTNDVLSFYAAMDIVVLPSRREGFGLTLIEAGALELPTIATRVTGCVDAVVDGITGLLVEVDNSEGLHEAMLKLVKEPELRRKLGSQGRKRVEELFDSQLFIDKHISLYKELIDKDARY